MQPKYWTLLALAAASGRPLTPVQLQKALFLFGENVAQVNFYRFAPYDFGPFSSEVYTDAEQLEADGFASITRRVGD